MKTKKPRKILSAMEEIRRYEDRRFCREINKIIKGGKNVQITVQPCEFGHALIATTYKDRLVAVELGESLDDLVKTFVNRWSKTSGYLPVNSEKPDSQLVQSVLRAVNEGIVDRSIVEKMSLSGTHFQRQVWQSLLSIEPGTVETYQQIANRINAPRAVRAIGSAIGANPIAIIIPCHRVVRSDGSMGGYRWGENIKRKLLDRERTD